jgi:ABC-2 type transport system permease protein
MSTSVAAARPSPLQWHRVWAIVKRHAWVLRRSPHRWFDVVVWPVVDTLLFGSIGVYVSRAGGDTAKTGVAFLLCGILLFHVIFQAQISISVGFLEEAWSRNLLNLMTTPLTELEYVAGVALFGLAKLVLGVGVVAIGCWVFFSFNITTAGWGILPVIAVLLCVGWMISLFVIGLVLRLGPSAEVLAWGILFVIMPLSGVFTPIDSLPGALQPVARLLPTTRAFEVGRALVAGQPMDWSKLGSAALGTAIGAVVGLWFVLRMLRQFRDRGFVTRFS